MKIITGEQLAGCKCSKCGRVYEGMVKLSDDTDICYSCLLDGVNVGSIRFDKSKLKPTGDNYFSIYACGSTPNISRAMNCSGLFCDRINTSICKAFDKLDGRYVLKIDIPYDLFENNKDVLSFYIYFLRKINLRSRDYNLPVDYTFKCYDEEFRDKYLKNLCVFFERYFKKINRLCRCSYRDIRYALSDGEATKLSMSKEVDVYDIIFKKRTEMKDGFNTIKSPLHTNGNLVSIRVSRGSLDPLNLMVILDLLKSFSAINHPSLGNVSTSSNLCKLIDLSSHRVNVYTLNTIIGTIETIGYNFVNHNQDRSSDFGSICRTNKYRKRIAPVIKRKEKKEFKEFGHDWIQSYYRNLERTSSIDEGVTCNLSEGISSVGLSDRTIEPTHTHRVSSSVIRGLEPVRENTTSEDSSVVGDFNAFVAEYMSRNTATASDNNGDELRTTSIQTPHFAWDED